MDESSTPPRGAFTSLICSILAWVGLGLMFFGSRIWPDFFFSHQKGTVGWPALPLVLLIIPTAILWFVGLLGGSVALVMLHREGQVSYQKRTRDTIMAWTAVILGLIPPAVALWTVSLAAGIMLLLFLFWRRQQLARAGAKPILRTNAAEDEVDNRFQRTATKESEIAEPKSRRTRIGRLTVVALVIAILIPLVLVVITKNAPGGHLNYEILLVGPAYVICLGCDAFLLLFAIQRDRKSGRASLPIAPVVVMFLVLALFGVLFMW